MVFALINLKGGTGKTTTAVNLAAALALMNKKTLLIDMDPQASATHYCGFNPSELDTSIADVIFQGSDIKDVIRETSVENLHLAPAQMELASADLMLADVIGREIRMKEYLEPVRETYDFIFIDCPPSLSLLSINALVSADYMIIPIVPSYLPMEGLKHLLKMVNLVKENMKCSVNLLGLLLSIVDYRLTVTKEAVKVLRDHFQDKVFKTEIAQNAKLIECPSFGQTIFQYSNNSSGSRSFKKLADEVLNKLGE